MRAASVLPLASSPARLCRLRSRGTGRHTWLLAALLLACSGLVPLAAKKTRPAPASPSAKAAPAAAPAPAASLTPADLADFDRQPAAVRQLLAACLELTGKNLGYRFGSHDPAAGGMDCSGTIYHVLQAQGMKAAPRDAFGQYRWVWESGGFRAVHGRRADTFELSALRPGDLLFWSGTYTTKGRDPAVSHVMIYLGRTKSGDRPVMFGASDGRTYQGIARHGVSAFDFLMPKPDGPARFLGYATVPGLR